MLFVYVLKYHLYIDASQIYVNLGLSKLPDSFLQLHTWHISWIFNRYFKLDIFKTFWPLTENLLLTDGGAKIKPPSKSTAYHTWLRLSVGACWTWATITLLLYSGVAPKGKGRIMNRPLSCTPCVKGETVWSMKIPISLSSTNDVVDWSGGLGRIKTRDKKV